VLTQTHVICPYRLPLEGEANPISPIETKEIVATENENYGPCQPSLAICLGAICIPRDEVE